MEWIFVSDCVGIQQCQLIDNSVIQGHSTFYMDYQLNRLYIKDPWLFFNTEPWMGGFMFQM